MCRKAEGHSGQPRHQECHECRIVREMGVQVLGRVAAATLAHQARADPHRIPEALAGGDEGVSGREVRVATYESRGAHVAPRRARCHSQVIGDPVAAGCPTTVEVRDRRTHLGQLWLGHLLARPAHHEDLELDPEPLEGEDLADDESLGQAGQFLVR